MPKMYDDEPRSVSPIQPMASDSPFGCLRSSMIGLVIELLAIAIIVLLIREFA